MAYSEIRIVIEGQALVSILVFIVNLLKLNLELKLNWQNLM